jgi:hypothetical protein
MFSLTRRRLLVSLIFPLLVHAAGGGLLITGKEKLLDSKDENETSRDGTFSKQTEENTMAVFFSISTRNANMAGAYVAEYCVLVKRDDGKTETVDAGKVKLKVLDSWRVEFHSQPFRLNEERSYDDRNKRSTKQKDKLAGWAVRVRGPDGRVFEERFDGTADKKELLAALGKELPDVTGKAMEPLKAK